jgi:hypothetical protein
VTLRRGFKSEGERISAELREELSLGPLDRLDPLRLAEHLGIPVFGLKDLARFDGGGATFIRVLRGSEREAFSAITVFCGGRRLVIHNDSHAPTRQASSVTHELSHCILEHPPSPILSPEGCRHWNSRLEEEADWLAGALLVPREGALTLTKRGWPLARIAERYAVSEQLCRRRVNETGVAIQARRWAAGW